MVKLIIIIWWYTWNKENYKNCIQPFLLPMDTFWINFVTIKYVVASNVPLFFSLFFSLFFHICIEWFHFANGLGLYTHVAIWTFFFSSFSFLLLLGANLFVLFSSPLSSFSSFNSSSPFSFLITILRGWNGKSSSSSLSKSPLFLKKRKRKIKNKIIIRQLELVSQWLDRDKRVKIAQNNVIKLRDGDGLCLSTKGRLWTNQWDIHDRAYTHTYDHAMLDFSLHHYLIDQGNMKRPPCLVLCYLILLASTNILIVSGKIQSLLNNFYYVA